MNEDIQKYNDSQNDVYKKICETLYKLIDKNLPNSESKIWHRNPVWFLDGNPVVGYAKLKDSVQMLFWSGQSFSEPGLEPEGSFKAAQVRYTNVDQINQKDILKWLTKAQKIQWDYKNIVKKRGVLDRLK